MEFHLVQFLRENDGRAVMDLDLNRQVAAAKTTACNVHLELLHIPMYRPGLACRWGQNRRIVCGRVHHFLVLGMHAVL